MIFLDILELRDHEGIKQKLLIEHSITLYHFPLSMFLGVKSLFTRKINYFCTRRFFIFHFIPFSFHNNIISTHLTSTFFTEKNIKVFYSLSASNIATSNFPFNNLFFPYFGFIICYYLLFQIIGFSREKVIEKLHQYIQYCW